MIAGVHDLPLFIVAGLLLNITPGADMALIGARSASLGFRAGAAAALGVGAGCVVHVAAAALGLSALVASSATAFTLLRWAGAAYLVWLGIALLRTRDATLALPAPARGSLRRLFSDGALSNLSNPKIAIFYFAFLPQFVPPRAEHSTLSVCVLGLVFAALTFAVKGPVGWGAGRLSGWLRARPAVLRWIFRGSGGVLVALGLRLAFERRS